MSKIILLIGVLIIPSLGACQVTDGKYDASVSDSKIVWEANYITGGGHTGTLKVKSGFLQYISHEIAKGEVVIDMKSIKNTDQKDRKNQKELEEHLMNDDFFSVDKFPTATFQVVTIALDTQAGPNMYQASGNLLIKGKSNLIRFPVKITENGKTISVVGEIIFDRTKWDVNYKSKTIFSDLKNSVISDDVKMNVDLKFKMK